MDRFFLTLILISFTHLSWGQQRDLSTLAAGEFLGFYSVDEREGDLYGYVATYRKDRLNAEADLLEVVVMDKNLNVLSQVEFQAEHEVEGYRPYFNANDQLVLYPEASVDDLSKKEKKKFKFPTSRVMDLVTNRVSPYTHICLEEGKLIDCPENLSLEEYKKKRKKDIKKQGYIEDYSLYTDKDSTYTALIWNNHQKKKGTFQYISDERIVKYDGDRNIIWQRDIHKKAKKSNFTISKILYSDEQHIYFYSFIYVKSKLKSVRLIGLTAKTGEEMFNEDLSKKLKSYNSSFGLPSSVRSFDNNLIITGRHSSTAVYGRTIGYYQINIDKGTAEIKYNGFVSKDLKKKIDKIDRYGNVGKGYFLSPRAVFPFEDGRCLILTEKLKTHGTWTGPTLKSKDFVLIVLDEDFKVKSTKVIEKDKSKNSFTDLIFTQYLNDKKDYVFFYKDYRKDDKTKKKDWILGIVTLIDGEIDIEEIPMASDDFFIYPYIAKEGYVLLHEFNKKSKYNQVRLERLNF